MKHTFLTVFLFITCLGFGQHLYPEKYEGCTLSRFCLDCGDTKAEAPESFINDFLAKVNEKALKKIEGTIEVQILVDSIGRPCLLSANNKTNVKSKKLKLQQGINASGNWSPAISKGKAEQASVSLLLVFENEGLSVKRRVFDFKNSTNMKSVGTPDVKGSRPSELSESFTVYNQANSDLPWDMSRVAFTDRENALWFGTDDGLVKMKGEKMEIFNCHNSGLKPTKYNKERTTSIGAGAVDYKNTKWFIGGYEVYRYDNKKWTVFDSINSPVGWMRKIFIDKKNKVYFTSSKGVVTYDGVAWAVIDSTNSKLPINNTSGVFVDSKERLWIGTYGGNIRIDKKGTTEFNTSDTPLKEGIITGMYEDKEGSLWFDLYNEEDASKAGIVVLKPNGEWITVKPKRSKLFTKNDVNDFLLDEDRNVLWIALNGVGLIKHDLSSGAWETYTPENSNVPSIHVMRLTKDGNGTLWAATFAGIIKLNSPKKE